MPFTACHVTLFGGAQGQRLRRKKRGVLPSPWLMVRAWLSAVAPRGWEDKNSVTLNEADSVRPTSFPPGWLWGNLQKENKSCKGHQSSF